MKATELRIGNHINDMFNGRCEVRGITEKGIWIRDNGSPAPETSFNPIPLTEEWLLKFGFTKDDGSFKLKNFGRFMFHDFADHPSFYPAGYTKTMLRKNNLLYYVHQLQNLYAALTGEELTIKETV